MKTISPTTRQTLKAASGGFSLIEVVVAISIVTVTFLGILGLLGVGMSNDRTSFQQTTAINIAEMIVADLRSTPAYSTKSTRFSMILPTSNAGTASAPFSGSGANPTYYLYFDNSPSLLPLNAPTAYASAQPSISGAVYVAAVYLSRINTVGPTSTGTLTPALVQSNDMVRVVITWPAQPNSPTPGSVDIISQFLVQ